MSQSIPNRARSKSLCNREHHIKAQAGRTLEHIRVLDQHYGPMIAEMDVNLADSLASTAAALDRFLAEPAKETAQAETEPQG